MGILGDIIGSNSKGSGSSSSVSNNYSENQGTSSSLADSFSKGLTTSGQSATSKSSTESGNKAYSLLNDLYSGVSGQGTNASYRIANLLGLGSQQGQAAAMEGFRNQPGYQFLQDEGARAVEGSFGGSGVYQSGAAMKALQDRAMGVADQSYGSYMDRLFGLSNQGNTAGGLISGAGGYSTGGSDSYSSGGSTSETLSTSRSASESQNTGMSQGGSVAQSDQKNKSGSGLLGQILSL